MVVDGAQRRAVVRESIEATGEEQVVVMNGGAAGCCSGDEAAAE